MGRDDEWEAARAETIVSPSHPGPERASRPTLGGLAPGVSIGRYRLDKRIGAGAMGVVWSAQDPQLDRMVAIKVVHPNFARSPEAASRLMREARAMAKVKDRSVVTIHDAGDEGEHLFIAMELVEGTNLGTLLRERAPQALADWQRWLGYMLDAGRGLVAAHRVGILHRDFKPDNVLVDDDGRVCVGDFGLATLGGETIAALTARWDPASHHDSAELTSTGALVGTPVYMSPQQLRSQTVDARADQFAFCVAAWEALYGARPFSTDKQGYEGIAELAELIDQQALPPVPANSTVPDGVRAVLLRGLSADPDARWPDMISVLAELQQIAHPRLQSTPSIDVTAGIARETRRSRIVIYAAIGLALAGAATALVLARSRNHAAAVLPAIDSPSAPVAKELFAVALRTGLALSPSGRYFALYSDRLQVRDVESDQLWSMLLADGREISHLEVDDDTVRFGYFDARTISRWKFRSSEEPVVERELPGTWAGTLSKGELVYMKVGKEVVRVDLVDANNQVLHSWATENKAQEIQISPDRHRFTYLEDGRFESRIAIGDDRTDALIRTAPIVSPTSVSFLDSDTVIYANGTLEQPRMWKAPMTATGIGDPVQVYGMDSGWFGPIRVHGRHLFTVLMQPQPRTILVQRDGTRTVSRNLDNASVTLGWISPTEFLSWNRNSQFIERRTKTATVALTQAKLEAEPANATVSNGIVIAALRRSDGREAVAVSIADGHVLWRHQDRRTLAVRCAGDLHPPCFAIRIGDPTKYYDGSDQLVTLDPATGELGTTPIYTGTMADLAVSPDGTRIRVVANVAKVTELDPKGTTLDVIELSIGALRSIAFDPLGGMLLGGTRVRNNYLVVTVSGPDNKLEIVAQSEDDILSLVRPSPTGADVLVIARVYAPRLWQLEFPQPLSTAK
ncbi:hypothetical protein BH11MYX2_BH11MYX2_28610 [soil metagenome]